MVVCACKPLAVVVCACKLLAVVVCACKPLAMVVCACKLLAVVVCACKPLVVVICVCKPGTGCGDEQIPGALLSASLACLVSASQQKTCLKTMNGV